MPNCFSLFRKGGQEPVAFQQVDEEICRHFDVPADPVRYACGWYDAIGFRVAIGKSLPEIREEFQELEKTEGMPRLYQSLVAILDFIAERYVTDCWAEVGR